MAEFTRRGLLRGLASFAPIALLAPTLPALVRRPNLDLAPIRHLVGPAALAIHDQPLTVEEYHAAAYTSYVRSTLWPHAEAEAARMGLTIDSYELARVAEWQLKNPDLVADKAFWPTLEQVTQALAEEKGRFVQEGRRNALQAWYDNPAITYHYIDSQQVGKSDLVYSWRNGRYLDK